MVVLPADFVMLVLPAAWTPVHLKAIIVTAVLALALLTNGARYRARLHVSVLDDIPGIVGKVLAAAGMVATLLVLKGDQIELESYLRSVAAAVVLIVLGRIVTCQLIIWSRRNQVTRHRTVIIGGGPLAAELADILGRHPRYGLSVVGFVDEGAESVADSVMPRLGQPSDLDDLVRALDADVLLIADGAFCEPDLHDLVRGSGQACDLLVIPRMNHFHTQTGMADHIGSIPVMRIRVPSLNGPARMIKRAFDIGFAGTALILVSPVMALCALAVRLEGGPGVIFRQPRVGRDGNVFDCLKLRSMRPASERDAATTWSVATDRRVGPVGRFLRRTSLDEIPQLWNILRGDMTLVGPRPERPHFVDRFSAEFDRYAHRHRVQAGLTGLAQVSGLRGDTPIADRARFDNYYIENWSLWLDLKIILRTFSEVLFARGR
jgi:exopolysaccharide biosynthesis polyprenyl glycosylphosphotransferase